MADYCEEIIENANRICDHAKQFVTVILESLQGKNSGGEFLGSMFGFSTGHVKQNDLYVKMNNMYEYLGMEFEEFQTENETAFEEFDFFGIISDVLFFACLYLENQIPTATVVADVGKRIESILKLENDLNSFIVGVI